MYLKSDALMFSTKLIGINIFGLTNPHKQGLLIFEEYNNFTLVFI